MRKKKMVEWKTVKLGDICSISTGKRPLRKETHISQEYPIPVYGGNGISWFTNETLLDEPVILTGRVGTIGTLYRVKKPCWVSDNALLISPKRANFDFVFYILKLSNFTALNRGSTQPLITQTDVKNLEIPLPPLDVQKRIAGILGALDDRIDVLRRENVVLEQMAQAVFQSWFVDFDIVRAKAAGTPESEVCEKYHITPELYALFPSALTPDNLPLGWEKKKLGDFLILSYGKALKENDRVSGSVPVYGSSGQIGTHNESLVKAPGIVVGRKGTVGSVIWCDYDFYPIDTVFYVQFLKEGACWYFAYFLLKILKLQNLAGDSAVPGLNRDAAYAQTFVCPRTELLSSFEEVADVLFCKIKNNAEQIRTLSATRDALLPKLMNGEIEV